MRLPFLIGCAALAACGQSSPDPSVRAEAPFAMNKIAQASFDQEAKPRMAQTRQATAGETEDKRKGFHCLSSWDGSNRSLVSQVKEGLRNPSSFEHADTEIGPEVRTGFHPLKMKYRAENGFGGMNVEEVVAAVDHETCRATIITSVEQMNALLPAA